MKTKREILKSFALNGSCDGVSCSLCQYDKTKACTNCSLLRDKLIRIGAMTILRMFPEKREFDTNKILTCVTADKAKTGMRGYFADDLVSLKSTFEKNFVYELLHIHSECFSYRFRNANRDYPLFYPIDGVEE